MADLAALEARVTALEHIAAIKALKYRYLRACDRKDPAGLRETLDPRGCIIAYEGFPTFQTREAFVEVFTSMACRESIFDMHHGANPEITLTGPDSATGIWELYFHSIDSEARTTLQMGCVYTDSYSYHSGNWWISRTATRRTSFLLSQISAEGSPRVLVLGAPPDAAYGSAPAAEH